MPAPSPRPLEAAVILELAFWGEDAIRLNVELEGGGEMWAHSRRVANYALLLARALAIQEKNFLRSLALGALFHDIGKIVIPPHILRKPESLSPKELEIVQEHPLRGYEMISALGLWRETSKVILYHHERYDGRGYPFGIAEAAIPLSAKILAVADALEAMTSDRPYRRGRPFPAAAREIFRCRGAQFDPEIVEAFLTVPFAGSAASPLEKDHGFEAGLWPMAEQAAAKISAECLISSRGAANPRWDFI